MHTPKPYHCRHIFTDGHQCGSPALHGEPLCYYHHAARRPDQLRTIAGDAQLAFPEPIDLHAIQRGLAQLLRLTAAGHIEDKHSRTLLRILATASANLARIDRQNAAALKADPHRAPVQDYALDPPRGTLAPAPRGDRDQPIHPEPRPQGPLPDPVTQLHLRPNLEIVRDPVLQELDQLRAEKLYREAQQNSDAADARHAALTPTQRAAEHQALRNRFPAALQPIFDQIAAEETLAEVAGPPPPPPPPTAHPFPPPTQPAAAQATTQPQPAAILSAAKDPETLNPTPTAHPFPPPTQPAAAQATTQPQPEAPAEAEAQTEAQTYPQPNQDFGLFQSDRETHLLPC